MNILENTFTILNTRSTFPKNVLNIFSSNAQTLYLPFRVILKFLNINQKQGRDQQVYSSDIVYYKMFNIYTMNFLIYYAMNIFSIIRRAKLFLMSYNIFVSIV